MALAIDATSNSGDLTSVSSATWSHTCSGSDRILVVGSNARGVISDTNTTVTGVTYNGVALTNIRGDTSDSGDTFRCRTELWYLIAPATGAHDIVVTYTGTVEASGCGAISLTGAVQGTGAIDAHNGAVATIDTTPSVDVTVVENGCYLIDSIYSRSDTLAKDASQTTIMAIASNGGGDDSGMTYKYASGTGSKTMAWTCGAEETSLSAVSIAPSGITFDAVSTGMNATDPSSLTWSHTTTTGSNRILVVATSTESDTGGHTAQTVSGITYAGAALTKIRTDYITDNGTELWYKIAPATGANNIVVTMTGTVDGLFGAGLTFTGVHQTNPIDTSAGTTTTGLSISQDITTNSVNDILVNITHHYNSAAVLTPDGNQTEKFNTPTTGDNDQAGGIRYVTTAGSYTTSWTNDISDGVTLSVVALRDINASATVVKDLIMSGMIPFAR